MPNETRNDVFDDLKRLKWEDVPDSYLEDGTCTITYDKELNKVLVDPDYWQMIGDYIITTEYNVSVLRDIINNENLYEE